MQGHFKDKSIDFTRFQWLNMKNTTVLLKIYIHRSAADINDLLCIGYTSVRIILSIHFCKILKIFLLTLHLEFDKMVSWLSTKIIINLHFFTGAIDQQHRWSVNIWRGKMENRNTSFVNKKDLKIFPQSLFGNEVEEYEDYPLPKTRCLYLQKDWNAFQCSLPQKNNL